jgi:type II secretory pathway component PulJ
VSRFLLAMFLFAVLGVAAWRTLSDGTTRAVTLAVIASFAVRTFLTFRSSGGK